MAKQHPYFDDQNKSVKRLLDLYASGLSYAQKNSLYANESQYISLGLSPIIKTIPKNGLFSSVSLYKTDCQTAKDEDVIKICFLYIDLDFKDKEGQQAKAFKQMRKEGNDQSLVEMYKSEIEIISNTLSEIFGQNPFNISLSGGGFHAHYRLDHNQGWTAKGLTYLEGLGNSLANQGLDLNIIKNQVLDFQAWADFYKSVASRLDEALKDTALGADKVNFSPCRLLRDLGFKHLKDETNQMLIRRIDEISNFKSDPKSIDLTRLLAEHQKNQTPITPPAKAKSQPIANPPKDNQSHPNHTPQPFLNIDQKETSDNDGYYNFKPSQRIHIYPKGSNQGTLISFSELLKKIRNAGQRTDLINQGFIILNEHEKGIVYNMQASLFEGDFIYKGKPADVGSIFLTIKPKFELKNDIFKFATIEARIRNQVNSRYLEALDGCHWGVFPPRYYVDISEPLALADAIIDLIENKLDKQLYLYRQELCIIDLSSSHPFQVVDLDDLKLELAKAKWIGAKEKEINFETNSSVLKLAYRSLIKSQTIKEIKSISSLPLLDESFQIKTLKGYDESSKTFIASSSNLNGFKVDLSISQNEMVSKVKEEMAYIYSCFRFPTKTREHFVQILAGLLQLFLSSRIRSKPFISISANDQGRGKTLLAKALSTFITGIKPNIIAYEKNQQTMKDEIVANLNKSSSSDYSNDVSFIIDNIDSSFGNGFLNSMLTAGEMIKMRPKYSASIIEVKIPFSFIGTGNHTEYNADLGRRTFPITLDSSGMGLSSEDYIYEGRAEGNKGKKQTLRDDAYLDFLASEHEEGIKSLIRILAYANAIKGKYSDEMKGLKRMPSFSDFDIVLETCFIVAKCLNFENCDLLNLKNADMDGQTKDIELYDTFISSLQSLLGGECEDFNRTQINLKVKALLDPVRAKWESDNDKILIDQLESARIIEGGKLASKGQLDRLFNQCRGKKSKAGFTLKKLEKTTGGSTWYSIEKITITTRPLLYDDQVERVGQKVEQVGQKVERVGQKVEQVGQKVERVGQKVERVEQKVERVEQKVEQVERVEQKVEQVKQIEQVKQVEQLSRKITKMEAETLQTQMNETLRDNGLIIDFIYSDCDLSNNPTIQITKEGSSSLYRFNYRTFIDLHLNQKYPDDDIKRVVKSLYKFDLGKAFLLST